MGVESTLEQENYPSEFGWFAGAASESIRFVAQCQHTTLPIWQ